jgi:hypothetical protein
LTDGLPSQRVEYRYRPEVLEELATFGLRPCVNTPPAMLRAYLNDLYRWQLRQLRDQLLARAFPKAEFAARVEALRRKYILLSIPVGAWMETEGDRR